MQANNFQDPAMPRFKGNHGNEDTHVAWGSICESQYFASSLDVRRHSKIFCLSKRKKLKNLNFQKRFASAIDIKCSRKGSSILGKKCFGSNVFPFLMEPLEVGCTEGRAKWRRSNVQINMTLPISEGNKCEPASCRVRAKHLHLKPVMHSFSRTNFKRIVN